jgi:hypothetical protein
MSRTLSAAVYAMHSRHASAAPESVFLEGQVVDVSLGERNGFGHEEAVDERWKRAAGQSAWSEQFRCTKQILLTSIFSPASRSAATGEHRTAADPQFFFDQIIREQCHCHDGHTTGLKCISGWSRTATSQKIRDSVVIPAFTFRLMQRRWANVTMLCLSPQVEV